MITLQGHYYDGRTSARVPAECRIYDNGAVRVERLGPEGGTLHSLPRFTVAVSPRLGRTPRSLKFPDGAAFVTSDNDRVDEALRGLARTPRIHLVHLLETRWRWVLVCLAAVMVVVWGVGRYGMPAAAKMIAGHLPQTVMQAASRQTLEVLERSALKPTELETTVRERLERRFQSLTAEHAGHHLRVLFRKGGRLRANAFALPDGTVIFTDEMVALSANDEELLTVLAHEAGHVVHRHGLRSVIQNSLFAFLVLAITGDVSGTSNLFLGLPVVLTKLAYSRGFEREADDYALAYARGHGIAPRHFSNLMRRLEGERRAGDEGGDDRWSNYLSTHPSTEERLRPFDTDR
jgi:Zn-dependent protease with chaperone function